MPARGRCGSVGAATIPLAEKSGASTEASPSAMACAAFPMAMT